MTNPEGAPSRPPGVVEVRHPRGRIAKALPPDAPTPRRLVRALVRLGQGLHYHDALRAAPAMAFHVFLSLLPLLVFIGYVVGLFAQRRGVSAVLGVVLDNLPESTETVLKAEVGRLANARRLGPLAAVGFLWIASGGTQGLMAAVESVVGVGRRAWWKQRLVAVGWVLATLCAFGLAAFGIIQWDDVVHAPREPAAAAASVRSRAPDEGARTRRGVSAARTAKPPSTAAPAARRARRAVLRSGGERVLAIGCSLVAAVGGLCAFYRLAVSHDRRHRRRVLPGAALAVALWIGVSWAFSVYLRTLASYTVYYGSLAAVAVLLVWLWLVCLAILVGAELNAQLEGLRDEAAPTSA